MFRCSFIFLLGFVCLRAFGDINLNVGDSVTLDGQTVTCGVSTGLCKSTSSSGTFYGDNVQGAVAACQQGSWSGYQPQCVQNVSCP